MTPFRKSSLPIGSPDIDRPTGPTRARIPALDLLRFVAALSVMMFHYGYRGYMADGLLNPRFTIIAPVARFGYLGVNLFFMISGFVILISAEGKSAASFFQSRVVRLFPAYWVACTITYVSMHALGAAHLARTFNDWLANLTMLQGTFVVPNVDGVYWTLLTELRFYLLVFLVCATGLFSALPLLLAGWAGYAFLAMRKIIVPDAPAIYPYCIYFIAGAAFYLIYRRRALAVALPLVAVSGYMAFQRCTDDAAMIARNYGQTVSPVTLALVVGTFFVIFALIASRRLRLRERAWMSVLGAMTYPLYLLHQFLGYALLNKLTAGAMKYRYIWLVVVVLFLLALSWTVNRFVEIPGARLLRAIFAAGVPSKRQRANENATEPVKANAAR